MMDTNSNKENYRLLKEGEMIKLGDQFKIGSVWKNIEEGNNAIGKPFKKSEYREVRRVI